MDNSNTCPEFQTPIFGFLQNWKGGHYKFSRKMDWSKFYKTFVASHIFWFPCTIDCSHDFELWEWGATVSLCLLKAIKVVMLYKWHFPNMFMKTFSNGPIFSYKASIALLSIVVLLMANSKLGTIKSTIAKCVREKCKTCIQIKFPKTS